MALRLSMGAGAFVLSAAAVVGCSKPTTATTSSGEAVGASGYVTEAPTSTKDPDVTSTEVTHKFTGNIADANAGRILFMTHNCVGCHGGLAGGGMGPSLRDTVWKFGGSEQELFASIHDGRPNGMPAWGKSTSLVGEQQDTLSDHEIQQIIAYIHSMRTSDEPTFFFWNQQPGAPAPTAAATRSPGSSGQKSG
jgi:mono/diheme cytochrome c family protein